MVANYVRDVEKDKAAVKPIDVINYPQSTTETVELETVEIVETVETVETDETDETKRNSCFTSVGAF